MPVSLQYKVKVEGTVGQSRKDRVNMTCFEKLLECSRGSMEGLGRCTGKGT